MRQTVVVVFFLSLSLAASAQALDRAPVAVSPGDSSTVALVENRCPTFSWGEVGGAVGYELIAYRTEPGGEESQPVLQQTFPASVYSWTPSFEHSLERGGQYAWSVRALGRHQPSPWSTPSLFQVVAGPTSVEFEQALAVVQEYLGTPDGRRRGGSTGEDVVSDPRSAREPRTSAASPLPSAAAATQLSVDGGVEAASFTGDGSTLTALDPANLSAGTADIDISGTAAMANDVTGTAVVSESELDFDPTTQAELDSHAGMADAHHAPPTGLPPSGPAGGDLTGTYPNPGVVPTIARDSEVTSQIGAHAGLPNVHHTPTVDTDTVLTEAQVETYVTDDPLDMGNNPITNIGAAGTDFTAVGGMRLADNLRIDGDLGIGADPIPGTNANIYLYDGGIYSGPHMNVSGHNQASLLLERRRTDGGWYQMKTGCGSVNCADDFVIQHDNSEICIGIRDGCDVDIPTLEVDTLKSNPTDSPGTCDGTTEGSFYYDASLNEPCYCNGTEWRQFDGGGVC